MGRTRTAIDSNNDGFEVEILGLGVHPDGAFNTCPKKERHPQYCTLDTLPDLGAVSHDPDFRSLAKVLWDLTGKVTVETTDNVRYGTCFVQKVDVITNKPCPCLECLGHKRRIWGKVTFSTASHVIVDNIVVGRSQVLLFNESEQTEEEKPEKLLPCLTTHSRDEEGDWCALVCVSHDEDLLQKLTGLLEQYWALGRALQDKYQDSGDNLVVLVSHPHGGSKKMSFGRAKYKDHHREIREHQDWCAYSYDAATCKGSSGAPVYILGHWNEGFGYWFGHGHNHSGVNKEKMSSSTVGVHSTYGRTNKSYTSLDLDTARVVPDTQLKYVNTSQVAAIANDCNESKVLKRASLSSCTEHNESNVEDISEKLLQCGNKNNDDRTLNKNTAASLLDEKADDKTLNKTTIASLLNNSTDIRVVNKNTEIRVVNKNTDIRVVNKNTDIRVVNKNTDIRVVNKNTDIKVVNKNTDTKGVYKNYESACNSEQQYSEHGLVSVRCETGVQTFRHCRNLFAAAVTLLERFAPVYHWLSKLKYAHLLIAVEQMTCRIQTFFSVTTFSHITFQAQPRVRESNAIAFEASICGYMYHLTVCFLWLFVQPDYVHLVVICII